MWKVEDNGGNVLRARNLSSLRIATAFTRRMETGELLAVYLDFLRWERGGVGGLPWTRPPRPKKIAIVFVVGR